MTFDIQEILSKVKTCPHSSEFIWWALKNLAPGSYQVRLKMHGSVVDTYTFSSAGVGSIGQNNSKVSKKDYFKIDTSSKWYIDNNIIVGDVVSDETKSIYSVLIQDSSLVIKSGPDARERMVGELKKIDFQQSPTEFKEVYLRHIDAWEQNNSEEIESTWNEIKRIALKYGVRER